MKYAPALIFASALTALPIGSAFADNRNDEHALYRAIHVVTFFDKQKLAELKVTAGQESALKSSKDRRDKIWKQYVEDGAKLNQSKLDKKGKNAKSRTLEAQASEAAFKTYAETLNSSQMKRMKQIILQIHGMELFDFPEVLDALKIGDKEVKALRSAYDKLGKETMAELQADVKAKKITSQEAAKKAQAMSFSVPEQVRESLSAGQKQTLADLLGEKYSYSK